MDISHKFELIAEIRLKAAGYSNRAISYYLGKVNVGKIKNPSVYHRYTGPCGDTLTLYLNIQNNVVTDAKFQLTGCLGAFVAGSAITEMIKGKSLTEIHKIKEQEIIDHLGGVPASKEDCVHLARITLDKTIHAFNVKVNPPQHQ